MTTIDANLQTKLSNLIFDLNSFSEIIGRNLKAAELSILKLSPEAERYNAAWRDMGRFATANCIVSQILQTATESGLEKAESLIRFHIHQIEQFGIIDSHISPSVAMAQKEVHAILKELTNKHFN